MEDFFKNMRTFICNLMETSPKASEALGSVNPAVCLCPGPFPAVPSCHSGQMSPGPGWSQGVRPDSLL